MLLYSNNLRHQKSIAAAIIPTQRAREEARVVLGTVGLFRVYNSEPCLAQVKWGERTGTGAI